MAVLFTPPTVREHSSDPFFGRFGVTVGLTVMKVAGHYVTSPYPWLGDLAPLTEGTDYFLGGRTYEITTAVASALEADGYSTTATVGDESYPFGFGPYGSGPFGG